MHRPLAPSGLFFLANALAFHFALAIRSSIPITLKVTSNIFTREKSFLSIRNKSSNLHQSYYVPSLTPSIPSLKRLTILRGGSISDGFDDDYDFSDDDFDFEDDDGMFNFESAEDDFGDESTLTQIADSYHKTPPLTKAYLTASFGAALLGYISNHNDFPSILQLEWKPILTSFQIWRPLTAFLNFGPLGLGYLMTVHFVWTYMSTLERLNHGKPYDFWLMMLFGAVMMVGGYTCLGLSPRFLGHNLSTFLVYVWSRYHEGLEVSMFELFNTRAELLPWFFLAQTFLLEGEVPVLDFLGIVFGHIYHHYKTTNVLRTPRFVIQWYNGDSKYASMLREKYKMISTDFEL